MNRQVLDDTESRFVARLSAAAPGRRGVHAYTGAAVSESWSVAICRWSMVAGRA